MTCRAATPTEASATIDAQLRPDGGAGGGHGSGRDDPAPPAPLDLMSVAGRSVHKRAIPSSPSRSSSSGWSSTSRSADILGQDAGVHLRIWQYDVAAQHVDAFVAAYGADGDWVALFRRGAGFEGTELYRDVATPTRFLTVDSWASEAAWLAFRHDCAADYEALGVRLAPLSSRQQELSG